ncbi:hypothetical protein [Colwellia sp. Arc7-635]|nr:hypothetical protein [Colwellia sp. Arc7-635]
MKLAIKLQILPLSYQIDNGNIKSESIYNAFFSLEIKVSCHVINT